MNFSAMAPVVIGRIRVDNYLLGIPHQTKEGKPARSNVEAIGDLVDSTFYGRNSECILFVDLGANHSSILI